MSISRPSVRARPHGIAAWLGTRERVRASLSPALGSAALATCLLCAASSVHAQEQAPVGEQQRDETSRAEPVRAVPEAPGNARTPGAVVNEPVANADDAGFDDVGEESPESSFGFNEPTFNTETTRKRIPNVPLLATGTLVLAGAYVPAVIGAAVSDRAGDDKLYIPVAGPFLAMNRGADDKAGYKALLVADGIAQGLGGLGMLLSLMIPEKITRSWYLIGQRQVHVAPGRIAGGYGLSATGRF